MYQEAWAWPFLITTLLLAAWLLKSKMRGKSDRLPPGSRGWPLIGHSFSWCSAVAGSHPPRFVQEQSKRFGKIFSCSLFGKWAVVSTDPSFNRFVMQNEGRLFQSSYPKSFRDLVGKDGVITIHGDQQRRLHGIASNMMRLDKLKSHFLNHIQSVLHNTLQDLPDDQVISLQDVCRKLAIHLMVNQLLGVLSESEIEEMAQLFSDFVDGCLSLPINIPGSAYHSDDAVADFIINLLFAGNETTAKTMSFAVYFLTKCPQAMKHLLEEQERIKHDPESEITWEDYKAMPFTQCVIDETLRLGGIAIWLMRKAITDVAYQDFVIPKGCFVVPFLSAVHLDENLYEKATSFNPWRWMDPENEEKRNWRSSPFFSPFGGGARFCPGAELARLQIALFLRYFVTTYRWVQIKDDRMSFFPSARLVNGFQIHVSRRNTHNFWN